MKTLAKNELYEHLQGFLKAKGVELKEGSYAQKLQKSCALLSDAINTSQKGLTRAKVEIDKKLDQVRQVIHEKTAASGSSTTPPKGEPARPNQNPTAQAEGKKPRTRKTPKNRKPAA